MIKKVKEPSQGINSLILAIQGDSKLTKQEKNEFLSLANIYSADFTRNLNKSSMELSDESGLDLDTWKKFLSHPPIKRIIESYVNEKIKKKADSALLDGTGTRDAINVRKAMLEMESNENNMKFILLRIPDKVEDIHE